MYYCLMKIQTLECETLIVHQQEKTWRKILKFIIAFLAGLLLTLTFHFLTLNREVRKASEKVCEVFARDEFECRKGLDSVSEMIESEMENPVEL